MSGPRKLYFRGPSSVPDRELFGQVGAFLQAAIDRTLDHSLRELVGPLSRMASFQDSVGNDSIAFHLPHYVVPGVEREQDGAPAPNLDIDAHHFLLLSLGVRPGLPVVIVEHGGGQTPAPRRGFP